MREPGVDKAATTRYSVSTKGLSNVRPEDTISRQRTETREKEAIMLGGKVEMCAYGR